MKKILLVFIILIMLIGMLFTFKNMNNKEEIFEWKAKYIWVSTENETDEEKKDTWVCFRKKINIENEKDIKDVIAKIAVDSKYWLYINDEIVLREGQLKRGQKGISIYYDEVDLTPYLKEGENTISVLVWYFGKTSFSHIDSGKGALLFQTQIGDQMLISDNSWKAIKNPAYLKDTPITNDRLSEPNIYYDANLAIDDWYKADYDDSSWENAYEYGVAGDLPWGEMVARDIPQFKFSEIKNYENSKQYENYVTKQPELLELELPYNMQVTPYLKVEAEANLKIYVANDENYDEDGIEQKVTYVTKPGVQEFESPAWINGEKIYYYIPKGVKILKLGYRQTGYDTEMSGKFVSDDEFFNDLWTMANRTLYVNMRDNYMDCPDRERALWFGDTSVSMQEAMYGLDPNANYLYEKAVRTLIGWKHENLLMTVVPTLSSNVHLPPQMFLGIATMYDYYQYTGNKELLEEVYPHIKEYLDVWEIKEDGLVSCTNNFAMWQWGDSVGVCDYVAIENIAYYYALNTTYKIAQELDYQLDIIQLKKRNDNLYEAIHKNLWKDEGYKAYNEEAYDVRANAIAILSGLADKDKYETISKILINNTENSPYMEKYILEALCEIGKLKESQERIKDRYSIMVENQDYSSTLWEYWDKGLGSQNHAWAGGPLVIMSKYYAGIEPLKPGYEEISIKPYFGSLNNIESVVNTVKGKITLKADKTNEKIKLELEVPTKTLVAIEKKTENPNIIINNKQVYKKGEVTNSFNAKYVSEDKEYVYFDLQSGEYVIESK